MTFIIVPEFEDQNANNAQYGAIGVINRKPKHGLQEMPVKIAKLICVHITTVTKTNLKNTARILNKETNLTLRNMKPKEETLCLYRKISRWFKKP